MAFLHLASISTAFGDRDILKNINLNISETSRIALSGANGSGKSTLLKTAAGIMKPDSGSVSMQRGSRISYLPQSGISYKGDTLFAEAEKAFSIFDEVISRIAELEKDLASVTDDSEETHNKVEEHHHLQEKLITSGYYERDREIYKILLGLGFAETDMTRMTQEFSGGWQMRIALARVLLEKPDILFLDEPTNYLDIEARYWLEDFISSYPGGVVIVSHDRFFLDSTVNEIIELFNGSLKKYKGNYSEYEKKRAQELEELVKRYKQQEEDIAKTEYFIRKFRFNASKASLVQSRVKYLESIERIEIPESLKKIHFTFPPPPHSGKEVLIIDELSKSFGSLNVLDKINLNIRKGEKVVFAGKNGAGKTTLLKIVSGHDEDFTGSLRTGTDVKRGYFSQDFESTLTDENNVLEEIESSSPTEMIPQLRNLLGAFLFRGDDIFKKVSVLSGGEKNRVALLKLLLKPVNLLILDEPTNHLDINSKDILLEALQDYSGTLLFVSHDRYFIENLATRVIEIADGGVTDYPGDYEYYMWRKKDTEAKNTDSEAPNSVSASQGPSGQNICNTEKNVSAVKLDREQAKAAKRERKKLEKKAEDLLHELEKLEEKAAVLEHDMSLAENYSDGVKIKKMKEALDKNKEKQHEIILEWEAAESVLAELD